jgi:hypothetical protein
MRQSVLVNQNVNFFNKVISFAVRFFTYNYKRAFEFAISTETAYENPGVQLPESIITWVAIRGMPEYMNNLRLAVCMSFVSCVSDPP